jgi:hypothetical protein
MHSTFAGMLLVLVPLLRLLALRLLWQHKDGWHNKEGTPACRYVPKQICILLNEIAPHTGHPALDVEVQQIVPSTAHW